MRALSRVASGLGRQYYQAGRRTHAASAPTPPPPPSSIQAALDAIQAHPAKVIRDYLTPMPSHLLATTLSDLLGATSPPSSPVIAAPPGSLPPGHHLVYFPIQLPPSALVPDGADPHHAPGPPFTRRVWAGGEVAFAAEMPLDGGAAVCREKVEGVGVRGRAGEEKVFVDVWRRYGLRHDCGETRSEWAIEERRTLVFMREQEASPSAAPYSYTNPVSCLSTDPHPASHSVALTPSPTHLFHFSALSFNAHAIHFDPLYARNVDGHRALLVHGPLTLALMLRVLTDHLGEGVRVRRFTYRNHAPLYVDERMVISLRKLSSTAEIQGRWDVWVEGPEGGLAVKGTADVVPIEDVVV